VKYVCKVEFAGNPVQCFTKRFELSTESLLGLAFFIRAAMMSGARRATLTDENMSVSIETSNEWLETDVLEMAECIVKLLRKATEHRGEILERLHANFALTVQLGESEECVD
jgi:hypothetical protein